MQEVDWHTPVPPPEAGPGWTWRDVGLAVLVFFGGTGVAAVVIGTFATWLGWADRGASFTAPTVYLTALAAYMFMALGVVFFALRRGTTAELGLHMPPIKELALVPFVFIGGVMALLLVNGAIAILSGGTFDNPQSEAIAGGEPLTRAQFAALLLLIAGIVPLAEELLFRGMIYPLLRKRFHPLAAIPLNAALFAIAHVIPILLPGLFVVGMFIAYLRERSGSIWPSVLYHTLQNGLALFAIDALLRMA